MSSLASAVASAEVTAQLMQDSGAWDAYVSNHPDATAYHAHAWSGVIAKVFGHETRYLTVSSGGEIKGVLPLVLFRSRVFGRFAVSMPFLNYGGVLADSVEAEQALLEAAIDQGRRAQADYIELRHTRQLFPTLQAKRHKVAMELALQPNEDAQWQAIDRKVRNQVRKGQKSALRSAHGGDELVEDFYAVFARNMRDLGTPVYSIRWFREILRTFPSTCRIVVVYAGDRPVAGAFLLWHGSRIEVPWASALRESNALCANVFMYWELLRFAVAHGFERFDFGRSTPNEGTFHFKRQWGAEPRELVWEYWTAEGVAMPDLSPRNPRYSLAIAAWQRLPVGVTRMIGPAIVRNIA